MPEGLQLSMPKGGPDMSRREFLAVVLGLTGALGGCSYENKNPLANNLIDVEEPREKFSLQGYGLLPINIIDRLSNNNIVIRDSNHEAIMQTVRQDGKVVALVSNTAIAQSGTGFSGITDKAPDGTIVLIFRPTSSTEQDGNTYVAEIIYVQDITPVALSLPEDRPDRLNTMPDDITVGETIILIEEGIAKIPAGLLATRLADGSMPLVIGTNHFRNTGEFPAGDPNARYMYAGTTRYTINRTPDKGFFVQQSLFTVDIGDRPILDANGDATNETITVTENGLVGYTPTTVTDGGSTVQTTAGTKDYITTPISDTPTTTSLTKHSNVEVR